MSARVLDGTAVGQAIRADVRPDVEAFTREAGRPPGIALVLVGNDGGSELYVGSKLKSASEALGMPKKTFYDKLHRLNLVAEDFR